jgi:hypothetical protein
VEQCFVCERPPTAHACTSSFVAAFITLHQQWQGWLRLCASMEQQQQQAVQQSARARYSSAHISAAGNPCWSHTVFAQLQDHVGSSSPAASSEADVGTALSHRYAVVCTSLPQHLLTAAPPPPSLPRMTFSYIYNMQEVGRSSCAMRGDRCDGNRWGVVLCPHLSFAPADPGFLPAPPCLPMHDP